MKLRHSDQLKKRDVRRVSLFRILLQRMDYVSFCLLTEDPSVTKISAQYQDLYRSQKKTGAPNGNFRENICSEDDLRSRIFGAFVVKFLACLPLLGFSNINKMV